MAEFRLIKGSMQDQAMKSRTKIRIIGGGFGNGKTATACAIALDLAKKYPGSNGLIARSTYPKLNDTIRKEFIKWCPKGWIKSFPMSKNGTNTCTLLNSTTINFRYIAQQGKQKDDGNTTSNLLSATFDWIIVDQLEDPEIVEKDFDDLLGRLRGNTPYIGEDPTMPINGPRWFIGMLNPTRGWPYTSLVRPLHEYKHKGKISDKLLCKRDPDTHKPILDKDGKPILLLDLFEASTYANKHNLGIDFIETLEAKYRGSMKERFLEGKWAAYEGLVYAEFDDMKSGLQVHEIQNYLYSLSEHGLSVEWWETYDFGLQAPSCYMLGFEDPFGNNFLVDGFYEPEYSIGKQALHIRKIRATHGAFCKNPIVADPDIFRRKVGDVKKVGKAITQIFQEADPKLEFVRGINNIAAGILKVQEYVAPHRFHSHPITGEKYSPYFYYNSELEWFEEEINNYYWAKNSSGESTDKPQDKKDHAMDSLRYRLVSRTDIALIPPIKYRMSALHHWQEVDTDTSQTLNGHRYG